MGDNPEFPCKQIVESLFGEEPEQDEDLVVRVPHCFGTIDRIIERALEAGAKLPKIRDVFRGRQITR